MKTGVKWKIALALSVARFISILPAHSPSTGQVTADRPGSDFMVDILQSLGFEYIAANPGSSFRALHESVVNYGRNQNPELLTCCHEESSVALADGYARVEGKPMAVMAHSTVGLQHASMAIYNSFAARMPVFIVLAWEHYRCGS
jgi:thiamine pyrophosphate-dependent acetolactate synthase large subunit-like protein